MEEVLKQILSELNKANSRLDNLGQSQSRLKEGQLRLEGNQSKLEEGQIRLEANQSKLEEGQIRLEANQSKLEEGQIRLEANQRNFEEGLTRSEHRQNSFEEVLIRLDQGQQRIESRLDAVIEQTAGLIEFRTETLHRLDNIEGKFDVLAGELGKHKIDIELLKKRPV